MQSSVRRRGPSFARRRVRIAGLAALAALAAPACAQAHPRGATIALDYRSTVAARPAPGVRASVLDGDRRLRLSVEPGTVVEVLGYLDEPMLLLRNGAVLVNRRSPTAWADAVARPPLERAAAGGAPLWAGIGSGRAYAWHEHRLAPGLPDGVHRAAWSIPIVVDGTRFAIRGELVRVPRPAVWPWAVLAGSLVALGVAVAILRRPGLSGAAGVATAAVAGVSALVSLASFSLGEGSRGPGAWVELGAAGALAVAAAAGLVLARHGRLAVAGAIGALATIEGLGRLAAFRHGVVVAALPATDVRAADAVAIGAGLASLAIVVALPSITHREKEQPWRSGGSGGEGGRRPSRSPQGRRSRSPRARPRTRS